MIEKIDWQTALGLLLRYGYAGFLAVALFYDGYPNEFEHFAKAVGPIIVISLAFVAGAFIYTLFRHVIGDILLFPLAHFFHLLCDIIFFNCKNIFKNKKNENSPLQADGVLKRIKINVPPTAPTRYLVREKGVSFWKRRQAYTDVINELFKDDDITKWLSLGHAKTNILYLTFLIGLMYLSLPSIDKSGEVKLFFHRWFQGQWFGLNSYWWILVAIGVFAVIMDIKQHKKEYRMISAPAKQQGIDELLKRNGYI